MRGMRIKISSSVSVAMYKLLIHQCSVMQRLPSKNIILRQSEILAMADLHGWIIIGHDTTRNDKIDGFTHTVTGINEKH